MGQRPISERLRTTILAPAGALVAACVFGCGCTSAVHYDPGQKDGDVDLPARDGGDVSGDAAADQRAHEDGGLADGVDGPVAADGGILDGAPSADGAPSDTTAPRMFTCTIVIGPSFTYDWYTAGFETEPGIDNTRWEALAPSAAGASFIQDWADAANTALWNLAKVSPCAQRAVNPDRIIFVGVNWTYTTSADWLTQFEAVIKTIQTKFPDSKEIDLATLIRGPGNQSCGGPDETSQVVIPSFVDDAIQLAVANHVGVVKAAPKLEAPSCDVFVGPGPHLTAAGAKVVAKVYSDYYVANQ